MKKKKKKKKKKKNKKKKEIIEINKWMCMRDRVLQRYKVHK